MSVRKCHAENRSVRRVHEESLPREHSECFGYLSMVLPKVGALKRRGNREKRQFIGVPMGCGYPLALGAV